MCRCVSRWSKNFLFLIELIWWGSLYSVFKKKHHKCQFSAIFSDFLHNWSSCLHKILHACESSDYPITSFSWLGDVFLNDNFFAIFHKITRLFAVRIVQWYRREYKFNSTVSSLVCLHSILCWLNVGTVAVIHTDKQLENTTWDSWQSGGSP